MFWIKVLSIGISSLLVFTNGLPTSVLLDSKAAALKSGTKYHPFVFPFERTQFVRSGKTSGKSPLQTEQQVGLRGYTVAKESGYSSSGCALGQQREIFRDFSGEQ